MATLAQPQAARLDARAVGIMLVLCTAWGVQQVASKVALEGGLPPIQQALLRSAIAGGLLLLFVAGRGGTARLLARDGTLWPGLLTSVLFACEFALLFEGMLRIPASRAVVILYTAAFFTALGAHVAIPGERLRLVNAIGLLLAFAGVAATIGGGQGGGGQGGGGQGGGGQGGSIAGDLLVLGGAAAWGSTTVVVKASRALMRAPSEKVLAYQVLGSIPILLALTALSGEWHPPHASRLAWLSLAYQSVGVTFASYLTWVWLIGRYPAGRLAAFSFLTPLFGVTAAALLLGEPVTPMLLVGLVCVGVGLRLVNR